VIIKRQVKFFAEVEGEKNAPREGTAVESTCMIKKSQPHLTSSRVWLEHRMGQGRSSAETKMQREMEPC
jgi:hypothetical protein